MVIEVCLVLALVLHPERNSWIKIIFCEFWKLLKLIGVWAIKKLSKPESDNKVLDISHSYLYEW